MALTEGQFALGDATWGDGTALIVEDGEMALGDTSDEDAERPVGHGSIPGRDRRQSPTWTWELASDADDYEQGPQHALAVFEALATEWAIALELQPGELVPLSYVALGRARRVYGRPRRYAGPKPNLLARAGQARGAISFKLHDPFVYDEEESSTSIGKIAPTSTGNVTWPFMWGGVWGTPPGRYEGFVDNLGTAPAPFHAVFTGPVVDPSLQVGNSGLLSLKGSIGAGEQVTVDTREGTVDNGNTNIQPAMVRGNRLRQRLAVGTTQVSYMGTDPTNTSRVSISWRNAYNSI